MTQLRDPGATIRRFRLIDNRLFIIGAVSFLVGLVIFTSNNPLPILGVPILVLAVPVIAFAFRRISLTVHEEALVLQTLLGKQELFWDDIVEIRYALLPPRKARASGPPFILISGLVNIIELRRDVVPAGGFYSFRSLQNRFLLIPASGSLLRLEDHLPTYLYPRLLARGESVLDAGEKLNLHPRLSYDRAGLYWLPRTQSLEKDRTFVPWSDIKGISNREEEVGITFNSGERLRLPHGEVSNLVVFQRVASRYRKNP